MILVSYLRISKIVIIFIQFFDIFKPIIMSQSLVIRYCELDSGEFSFVRRRCSKAPMPELIRFMRDYSEVFTVFEAFFIEDDSDCSSCGIKYYNDDTVCRQGCYTPLTIPNYLFL